MNATIPLKRKGNTKVSSNLSELSGEETVIKLYNTNVVTFNAHRIMLNTGGWKTVTTKQRMNQASDEYDLGFTVFQRQGMWFVSFNGDEAIPFIGNILILERSTL